MYNYIGLEPRREAMHWQFGEMKFGEMKRDTSNWSNFGMLLRRAGLTASAGLSCIPLPLFCRVDVVKFGSDACRCVPMRSMR